MSWEMPVDLQQNVLNSFILIFRSSFLPYSWTCNWYKSTCFPSSLVYKQCNFHFWAVQQMSLFTVPKESNLKSSSLFRYSLVTVTKLAHFTVEPETSGDFRKCCQFQRVIPDYFDTFQILLKQCLPGSCFHKGVTLPLWLCITRF